MELKAIGQIVIGRSYPRSIADIQIKCSFISLYHCTITLMCDDNKCYYRLRDGVLLGKPSTNGTWVNKKRIQEYILQHGDIITFFEKAEYPNVIFKEKQKESYDETIDHEFES